MGKIVELSITLLFVVFVQNAIAATPIACFEESNTLWVEYIAFNIKKAEQFKDKRYIFIIFPNTQPAVTLVVCSTPTLTDEFVNVSYHQNENGSIVLTGNTSSGMESMIVYKPVEETAILTNISSSRSERQGWGTVIQSMYKCKKQEIVNPSALCNVRPNQ